MSDLNVQRLRRLDACAVSDALDKLQLPGVVTGLTQRSGGGRIAGRAVTMKVGPGQPPPGPAKHRGCTAIEQ
ncbi:MAG: RraA family protein, partial [Hydrogenophaga sp.]|nr:RraA family protein [Hydrogenophaga sp.]